MTEILNPEALDALNLTTINNDCKELIFEFLAWEDLLSVADTSKELYSSVCRVFKRKYGSNLTVDFGLPLDDA